MEIKQLGQLEVVEGKEVVEVGGGGGEEGRIKLRWVGGGGGGGGRKQRCGVGGRGGWGGEGELVHLKRSTGDC